MDHHSNLFYYGIFLPKWFSTEKGEDYQKWVPTIISDKREYFSSQSKKIIEKGFQFKEIPSELPRRWKIEHIKQFLDNKDNLVNIKGLFIEVRRLYEKYLAISNKAWYDIHSLWDIASYFYMLFPAFPFIELRFFF